MTTMMEVNMPGCRWLTVHGYECILRCCSQCLRAVHLLSARLNDQKLEWISSGKAVQSRRMLAGGTKPTNGTVVVRQVGRRWEVLAHFTDPKTTKIIIDELQKHSLIMLRTVEKLKEDLEKLPSPAPASLTATMEVLLAALKLAAVAEDKETTA
ncbi:hypothetical protein VTO58DRAFT_105365 [Aureobasidium pullulans]